MSFLKRIAEIANPLIGEAISYGNHSDRITVRIGDRTINAIAANCINSSKVLVVFADGATYCWSETSPIEINKTTIELYRHIKPDPEKEIFLPFQVLFTGDKLYLGGDRQKTFIFDGLAEVGGINNLGEQKFLGVWSIADTVYQSQNLTLITLPITYYPLPITYYWLGGGLLATEIFYPEIPQIAETIATTGQPLPSWLAIPPYPRPVGAFSSWSSVGSKTITKNNANPNYSRANQINWDGRSILSGNTFSPSPDISSIPIVCDFFTAYNSHTAIYRRGTHFNWHSIVNETSNRELALWINNQKITGVKNESYAEDYQIIQTPSIFTSSTSFNCDEIVPGVFGLYQWVGGYTLAQFTGENYTIERARNKNNNESILRPITTTTNRQSTLIETENYTESTVTNYPSKNWNMLYENSFLEDFRVRGEETKTSHKSQVTSQKFPRPLLISLDKIEAILLENIDNQTVSITENRVRQIDKILRDDSYDIVNTDSWIETTIVTREKRQDLLFFDGEEYYKFKKSIEFGFRNSEFGVNSVLTTVNVANLDGSPIFLDVVQFAIAYTKTHNKKLNQVSYSNTQFKPVPFWSEIEDAKIYLIGYGKRYSGAIASYQYTDEPNPDLLIETIRKISSVEIAIDGVENYPIGLVEQGEWLIVFADNMSSLLLTLTNDENRNYCNLVKDGDDYLLFFARSVMQDLNRTTQQCEVYSLNPFDDGWTLTQEEIREGGFIPVSLEDGRVLGISYLK